MNIKIIKFIIHIMKYQEYTLKISKNNKSFVRDVGFFKDAEGNTFYDADMQSFLRTYKEATIKINQSKKNYYKIGVGING